MYGAPSPGFRFRPRLKIYTDGQNNTFDPDAFEARSYSHWVYVAKIKGKVVFNHYYYSRQTRSHQDNMRALLKTLRIKIDVEVSTRLSLGRFREESLASVYEMLFNDELRLKRAKKEHVKDIKNDIKEHRETIRTYRALGAKFSRDSMNDLKKDVIRRYNMRLEDDRKERAAQKALKASIKPTLVDLGPIDFGVFTDATDLNEVNLNLNEEVSNDL